MPPVTPQQPQKEPVGPAIGVIIILLLMIAGAVYLWRVEQAQKDTPVSQLPSISSTTTVQ